MSFSNSQLARVNRNLLKLAPIFMSTLLVNCSDGENPVDVLGSGGSASPSGGSTSSGGNPDGASGGVTSSGGSGPSGGTSSSGGAAETATGGSASGGNEPGSGGETSGSGGESPGSGGGGTVTCPSSQLSPGDSNKTITVGGKQRKYVLHVPQSYNGSKAVPFIIDFHGITGDGPGERSSSPYPAQTDPDGVIMAFPTGEPGPIGNAWNVGPCCVAGVDDVEFARAIVEDVSSVGCIDPKRVYAVGFSMGGGMSHYLACHAADLFAAVAPAAFDLLEENVGTCAPSRPITVVSFRSTGDNVVDYDGGYSNVVSGMPITFLGAQDTFKKWSELNTCTGSAEDAGGGCMTYKNCKDGVTVTLCTKQGGSHEPGNASVAWPILKQNVLP